MASVGTQLSREGLTQAWALWIQTATGQYPNIDRHENSVDISFKSGQASKMEAYLYDAMSSKPTGADDLNVNVDLKPVLIPLAVKMSVGYVAGYTAAVIILTKLLWK